MANTTAEDKEPNRSLSVPLPIRKAHQFMLPYWLLFGFFAAGALFAQPDLRRSKPLGLMLAGFVAIVVMVGLRYDVGVDWGGYLRAWDLAGAVSANQFFKHRPGDPAFYGLLWGLERIGLPYWSLNLLCAIPFTVGLIRFARMQPNSWLAVAVAVPYLVIVTAMATTRQATAIGFVFLALVSFKRENVTGFFLWTLAGAAFHSSAILVIPFAGLSLTQNRFQSAVLLLITAVGGYLLLGSTFETYSRDYLGRYTLTSSGTAYRIVMNVIPAIFYLALSKRLPFADRERTLWRNFSLLAVASVPLLFIIQSTTALDRLLLYAFPLQIMMLAWLPYMFRGRVQQTGVILTILLYLALQQYVFFNYAANAYAYIPYRSVLFGN